MSYGARATKSGDTSKYISIYTTNLHSVHLKSVSLASLACLPTTPYIENYHGVLHEYHTALVQHHMADELSFLAIHVISFLLQLSASSKPSSGYIILFVFFPMGI